VADDGHGIPAAELELSGLASCDLEADSVRGLVPHPDLTGKIPTGIRTQEIAFVQALKQKQQNRSNKTASGVGAPVH
jgi:hypothetical protein